MSGLAERIGEVVEGRRRVRALALRGALVATLLVAAVVAVRLGIRDGSVLNLTLVGLAALGSGSSLLLADPRLLGLYGAPMTRVGLVVGGCALLAIPPQNGQLWWLSTALLTLAALFESPGQRLRGSLLAAATVLLLHALDGDARDGAVAVLGLVGGIPLLVWFLAASMPVIYESAVPGLFPPQLQLAGPAAPRTIASAQPTTPPAPVRRAVEALAHLRGRESDHRLRALADLALAVLRGSVGRSRHPGLATCSDDELDVLLLAATGLSQAEVATLLGVSRRTVTRRQGSGVAKLVGPRDPNSANTVQHDAAVRRGRAFLVLGEQLAAIDRQDHFP